MWWRKTKNYSKQILKNANLDPVPYAKDRLRAEFAKTLLEPLPVEQIDLGDSVDFLAEAILLSAPQWQEVKTKLASLSELSKPDQQAVISQLVDFVENQ
ncbi:hypothetical protein WBJ53_16950 [Spirosoma sp. SC4-14]|uniref:hypothetical protein n=1 Tax=Spirosoma sp. SC4-14 TaxID=3128900 RepID=UPI0030CBE633